MSPSDIDLHVRLKKAADRCTRCGRAHRTARRRPGLCGICQLIEGGGVLLVAEEAGQIVGYARFDLGRPESYLRSFAVAKAVRRALWGRRLRGSFSSSTSVAVLSEPDLSSVFSEWVR